jgi:UDP:flavonoid glycosyltransferase YjiC (YdhE family)
MRVLFTVWGWPSHYFPLVPLAWALRAAGHDVRVASQPGLLPAMRDSGLPATAVGRDLDVVARYRRETGRVDLSAVPATADEQRYRSILAGTGTVKPSRRSRLSLFVELADAMVDDLLALARRWRPDLVVHDPLTYAGPLVAKLVGVPAVRNLFGPDITYFTKVTGDAPGWTELLARHGIDEVDLVGRASVDPCPPSLQVAGAPTRRIHTRYVPYNGLAEVPPWLPDSPTKQRICLTWGTSTDRLLGGAAFLPSEVLLGCTKLADERDAELVVAITAGQRHLLPELPAHVRVVESVPLDALMPTCTAVVHQGGPGNMLTALAHGLPQLNLTTLVDQAANAYQLAQAGAGKTLAVAGLAAADLVAAGHDLLDDPAYRVAAQRLRQEALGLPSPADAVAELCSLA